MVCASFQAPQTVVCAWLCWRRLLQDAATRCNSLSTQWHRLDRETLTQRSTTVQDIPRLEMPLHTLIELVPKPDGKMAETRIKVPQHLIPPPVHVLYVWIKVPRRLIPPPVQMLCTSCTPSSGAACSSCPRLRHGLDHDKLRTRLSPGVVRQPCIAGRGVGIAHTGHPTCLQVDVETDLPKVQQQLAAQAASPGGPEAPSTPQTGVWNQHTGAPDNP